MKRAKLRSVDGASLLCGFALFVPVLGLRGALFSLFPGLAFRSKVLLIAGAVYGCILDIGFFMVWHLFGLVWEPRTEFNRLICHYLPPDHNVCTHCGCPIPNVVQVVGGLALWAGAFYLLWVKLWPYQMKPLTKLHIPLAGTFLMGTAGLLVWNLSPLNEWAHRFPPPNYVLDPEPLLLLFISVFPLCSLLVGLMISFASRAPVKENSSSQLSEQSEENV